MDRRWNNAGGEEKRLSPEPAPPRGDEDCRAICSLRRARQIWQYPARLMGKVGDKLRQARESSNLSIRDLSERTKIRTDHLQALEEGNYEVFSAPVYIRGFVRSCASALKLDSVEILADLDEELSGTERFADHPPLTPQSKGFLDWFMLQLSKINWRVALPLLVLALILAAGFFGYRTYKRYKSEDPLKDLGPGLYQGPVGGQTLPLPNRTNR